MEQLDAAFAVLASEYRLRKALAERAVRDWRWATSSWFDLRPLYFESNGWPHGRAVRHQPAHREGCVCCGFDSTGRVVVERQFNRFGCYETFFNWDTTPVEAAHFDYAREKKPINLLVVWIEAQRPMQSAVAAIHGYTHETYVWGSHGVTEIRVTNVNRKDGTLSALDLSQLVKASYGDDGTLTKVERVWLAADSTLGDITEVMFERRGKRIFRPRM